MLRKITLVGLVALLFVGMMLIAGCDDNGDANKTEGTGKQTSKTELGTYTIADSTGDWGYPSPYLRYSRGPGYIRMSYLFDTLVWKDQSGFTPALAKEWEYLESENAYLFKLQRNAKWHDGKPFTAEDVAFTVGYVKKHPDPFVTLIGPSGVKSVEVIDDYTVKLYLESTYAPFLNDIAGTMAILPKHIWENVDDPMTFDDPEAVIGTGPFKLKDYSREHGSYLYEANADYYLGRPIVDKLVYVKMNEQMIPAALKDGSVNLGSIPADVADSMKSDGFEILVTPYGWNAKLVINHREEPLSSKEMRQAIAYAIDREALVEITQRGHAMPGSAGMIPPDSEWYNPDIEQYHYNPDKARELIRGLGYELDGDYYKKDGKRLEFELLTREMRGFDEVAKFIKDQLEEVGIKIDLRSLESKSVDARVQAWDFDLAVSGHGGLYEPSILNKVITADGFNSARYTENEDLNQLLEAQLKEMDPAERLNLVQEIQAVYADELPALTLYYPKWYTAHDGQVEMFHTPGGIATGIPVAENKLAFIER